MIATFTRTAKNIACPERTDGEPHHSEVKYAADESSQKNFVFAFDGLPFIPTCMFCGTYEFSANDQTEVVVLPD